MRPPAPAGDPTHTPLPSIAFPYPRLTSGLRPLGSPTAHIYRTSSISPIYSTRFETLLQGQGKCKINSRRGVTFALRFAGPIAFMPYSARLRLRHQSLPRYGTALLVSFSSPRSPLSYIPPSTLVTCWESETSALRGGDGAPSRADASATRRPSEVPIMLLFPIPRFVAILGRNGLRLCPTRY